MMNIFILNWIFSVMFMFLNHPLSLGCILLLQTIIISLSTGFIYYNFWFGYILFLIMIGGMLVMFIYMTSIASNEKFNMPKLMLYFFIIMMMSMMMTTLSMDKFIIYFVNFMNITISQSTSSINITLNKFFNLPNMQMMIILMTYLLITLIATVKIIGKNFGTLRQK